MHYVAPCEIVVWILSKVNEIQSLRNMVKYRANIAGRNTKYRKKKGGIKERDALSFHFAKFFISSPRRVVLDVDETNSNTFGARQLTLFNDYYGEYCYMFLLMFDDMIG
jgi:hypothetical protein